MVCQCIAQHLYSSTFSHPTWARCCSWSLQYFHFLVKIFICRHQMKIFNTSTSWWRSSFDACKDVFQFLHRRSHFVDSNLILHLPTCFSFFISLPSFRWPKWSWPHSELFVVKLNNLLYFSCTHQHQSQWSWTQSRKFLWCSYQIELCIGELISWLAKKHSVNSKTFPFFPCFGKVCVHAKWPIRPELIPVSVA